MYVPRSFRVQDRATLAAFVHRYGFATLITPTGEGAAISHVPLLLEVGADDSWRLRGHLARANPHWRALGAAPATAIFHGPHSYISPGWYIDSDEVPTWNYAVVHATGPVSLFEERDELEAFVEQLVATYEPAYGNAWSRELTPAYRERQLQHIVGFEIEVVEIEGKFKLGQNRSAADQESMRAALASQPDADSRALAAFIDSLRDGH